jgi:hypothetical protein
MPSSRKITNRFSRTRRRRGAAQVNTPDPIPIDETPWLEMLPDKDIRVRSTGQLMSETNEGVTWADGEARLSELGDPEPWRSKGPILWAMRRVKFDRFAARTRPDQLAQEQPKELTGDACSLWALLRRDPTAIQRRDVRDAMERAGWPPEVVADLRAGEELSRAGRKSGEWVWVPGSCEWRRQKRGSQASLF